MLPKPLKSCLPVGSMYGVSSEVIDFTINDPTPPPAGGKASYQLRLSD